MPRAVKQNGSCWGKEGDGRELIRSIFPGKVWEGKDVLQMDGGDDCKTIQMHTNLLNCT